MAVTCGFCIGVGLGSLGDGLQGRTCTAPQVSLTLGITLIVWSKMFEVKSAQARVGADVADHF